MGFSALRADIVEGHRITPTILYALLSVSLAQSNEAKVAAGADGGVEGHGGRIVATIPTTRTITVLIAVEVDVHCSLQQAKSPQTFYSLRAQHFDP
jgi:hypothetical protein